MNIRIITARGIVFCVALMLFEGCDTRSDYPLLDERDDDYSNYDYYIDNNGNEGIVAYADQFKAIVLSIDEDTLTWGPMNEVVYTYDSISLPYALDEWSFSVAMLQCMVSRGIEKYPAQYWCYRKNRSAPYGGSWMLPSKKQLEIIFGRKGERIDGLNKALARIGGTPIASERYWTCCEDIDGYIQLSTDSDFDYDQANRAVSCDPYMKYWVNRDRWVKKNKYAVRAVKILYLKY
jgi:hypothetical protein